MKKLLGNHLAKMRVLILTWEYPPHRIGELSDYVYRLARTLVENGIEVYVITFHDTLTGLREEVEGIYTYRVKNPIKNHLNILTWSLAFNSELLRAISNIFHEKHGQIDLIDVHEWVCIPAALAFEKAYNIPFTFSIDSLEDHRSKGASTPFSLSIKSIEKLGMEEARRIIVKSYWMKEEVHRVYGIHRGKIEVVLPNSLTWIKDVIRVYETCRKL